MQWPSILKQGLSPALAIGVIAASIVTAVTTKSQVSPADAAVAGIAYTGGMHALWTASAAKTGPAVDAAFLHETGDITGGAWVETRAEPAVVGRAYGKLVVTREFGPSDEADADDIIARPGDHLVAVSVGFKSFTGGADDWVWARFSPEGKLLDQTGDLPSADRLADIAAAYCSSPLPAEMAARS